jgi:hypothetical protein
MQTRTLTYTRIVAPMSSFERLSRLILDVDEQGHPLARTAVRS